MASKNPYKNASKINEKGSKKEFGIQYPVEGPFRSPFGPHSGSIWSSGSPRHGVLGARSRPEGVKKGLPNAAWTLTDFLAFRPEVAGRRGGVVLALAGVREPGTIFEKRLLGVESQHHFRDLASEAPV